MGGKIVSVFQTFRFDNELSSKAEVPLYVLHLHQSHQEIKSRKEYAHKCVSNWETVKFYLLRTVPLLTLGLAFFG